MTNAVKNVARFVWGLSILGLVAIATRVFHNTLDNLIMEEIGPAVMAVIRTFFYNVKGMFAGLFSGARSAVGNLQAA